MAKGGHKKLHASKTETKKQPEALENKKHVTVDDTEDMNSGFGEYIRSGEGCTFIVFIVDVKMTLFFYFVS